MPDWNLFHPIACCALALLSGFRALVTQDGHGGALIGVKLVSGRRMKQTGQPVGLILTTVRRGQSTFRILESGKNGAYEWEVPARFCDGGRFTWYLVRGMTEESQIPSFFRRPMDWAWARLSTQLHQGSAVAEILFLVPRNAKILAKGSILGPGPWEKAKPLSRLGVRLGGLATRAGFCYNPNTGAFWIMQALEFRSKIGKMHLDLSCEPAVGPAMARQRAVLLIPEKDNRIQMVPEATISAIVKGWEPGSQFRIQATLRGSKASKILVRKGMSIVNPAGRGQTLQFRHLPPGRYSLEITTDKEMDRLWSRKEIDLDQGEHLDLGSTIDLGKVLDHVSIQVQDAAGRPIDSKIGYVVVDEWGNALAGGYSTRAGKTFQQQVPATGGRFRVESKGLAPRLLWGAKGSTTVKLHPARQVLVKIQGMPEDPRFRQSLFLRAEPVEGYPEWAWSALLTRKTIWSKPTRGQRLTPLRRMEKQFCMSRVDEEGNAHLLLTHPGLWRFQLIYSSVFLRVPVPIGKHPPAKIEKVRHAVHLEVEAADFEAPYQRFQEKGQIQQRKRLMKRFGR